MACNLFHMSENKQVLLSRQYYILAMGMDPFVVNPKGLLTDCFSIPAYDSQIIPVYGIDFITIHQDILKERQVPSPNNLIFFLQVNSCFGDYQPFTPNTKNLYYDPIWYKVDLLFTLTGITYHSGGNTILLKLQECNSRSHRLQNVIYWVVVYEY